MNVSETNTAPDDAVTDVVAPGTTLLCIVPEDDHAPLQRTLDATIALAAERDARVMLYDRSVETWADTDHSHEITDPVGDEELQDAPHVLAAMTRVRERGVEVDVWRSTIPAFATGILNAIQRGGADVIVLPADGGTTNTFEKLFGAADLADSVAKAFDTPVAQEADAARPVIVCDESGRLSLITN